MNLIQTSNAPAAIGPYSQAVEINNTLYVSGQLPLNPETMLISGEDMTSQTLQSLQNIESIVKAARYEITDIVKCTVFLKDLNDFNEMNAVYTTFFKDHKPARCAVEVSRLPKDVKVEIDAICVK